MVLRYAILLPLIVVRLAAQEGVIVGSQGVFVRPNAPPPPPPPGGSVQGVLVPPATSDKPPEKKGTMSGQVVAITGEPLNKAEVTARRTDSRMQGPGDAISASTDATGNFTLKDVDPGTYMLSAQRSGYVQQSYGARGPMRMGTMLRLSPGQDLKGLQIKLTRQAVISGKVTDEEGEPLTTGVQAMSMRYYRGKKQLMPAGFAQSNDLGEYRVANLFPGKYIIMTSQQRMGFNPAAQAKPKDGPEEGYTAMYYPGVFDPGQAVALDVAAGAELRSIDVRMKKTKVFRIKGKIMDGSSGKPAEQVMVMLMPATVAGSMGFMNRAMTNTRGVDGSFELTGVTPGSYSLMANKMTPSAGGFGGLSAMGRVDVGEADVEGLTVVMNPPVEVPGAVRLEGTTSEKPAYSRMRIMLEPLEGIPMNTPNASVNEDGTFKIPNAGAGKFRVNALNPPDGTYVKAVRLNNQEIGASGLDLTAGAPGPIEVILSARAAAVSGTVIDPKQRPVSGVIVVLIPTDTAKRDDANAYRTGTTDQSGGFQVKGIPPGEYLLLSWEDVEPGAWQDPEFLKQYETQAIKLKLGESAAESVQAKVILAENSSLDKDDNSAAK